jgi:hypothetical protein
MTSVVCKLEEQLTDQRSDQIAFRFSAENKGSATISVGSIEPRIPANARLLEVTDSSMADANARRVELLQELNRLCRQLLLVTSEDFRAAWVEQQKRSVQEIFTIRGIMRVYFEILFSRKSFEQRIKRDFETFSYKISAATDAREVWRRWMEKATQQRRYSR